MPEAAEWIEWIEMGQVSMAWNGGTGLNYQEVNYI